jgi:hypothetical protein
MFNYIISTLLISTTIWCIKPIRYYTISFFFDWFNEHETIGKFLGIKYGNDNELYFNRKDSQIYTPGIYKILVEWFVGININLDHSTYKTLIKKQFDMSKKVKLNEYLISLQNKRLNLEEFEDFLADSFLMEVKNDIEALNENDFNQIRSHNKLIRTILNSLTGETNNLLYKLLLNINNLLNLRKILLSLSPECRLFAIVPQFTILNKFVEMIITKKGNLEDLEFYEFVKPGSFLTILNKNELYIVRRHVDKTNSYLNIGLGVKGFQCPASRFVFTVISDIIDNLQKFNIKIEGIPIYHKSKRFQKIITNKKDIYLIFNYNE